MTLELNQNNFDKEISNFEGVTLVDFWAPWCGPCKKQLPIVEELSQEIGDKARVAKLNIEDNQGIALAYQVVSIPTLMIFKNGEPVERMAGMMPKSTIISNIEKSL